jgi:RNA-binding proteins (RRM domain)
MNIFVSNLNYAIKDDDLKAAFEEYGEVSSARVITDKFSGRSKGFGFVEMSDENGQKAIDALNGASFHDRTLNVAVSRPREESSRPRRDFGGSRGGNFNNNRY